MSSYGAVLAILAGSDSDAAVLTAASVLAGAEGRVRALVVRVDPVRVVPMVGEAGAAAAAELMTVLEEQAKARAARARSAFEAWRGGAGSVRIEFEEARGHPSDTAATLGRNADIVVVAGPRAEDEPIAADLVEACLFASGRPVLVVPGKAAAFGKRIVVFWDGGRTAARALGDAMPLLAGAEAITVLTAGSLDEEVPTAEAVAGRLRARGFNASARVVSDAQRDSATLVSAAREARCDLVVMGGYGHSRMREMILGGVTRHMLSSAPVPVLLSH